MKLTKAQRRYLAEANAEYWTMAASPPRVAMWRKLEKMGLLEMRYQPWPASGVRDRYRLTAAGVAALAETAP